MSFQLMKEDVISTHAYAPLVTKIRSLLNFNWNLVIRHSYREG